MVRTSVTQLAAPRATFLFLPHFEVICDLLLNRRTATRNLFVKLLTMGTETTEVTSASWDLSLLRAWTGWGKVGKFFCVMIKFL